jgi:uncharacterized sulfatase
VHRLKNWRYLLGLIGTTVCGAGVLHAATHPNMVLILADDLGWNALGCQGNQDVDTPNLDQLATEGMRFTQAYAEAQCSPTRGALFSGQWPARTSMFAVTHEQDPARAPMMPPEHLILMPPATASLALSLRAAGYTTGMSGKWHIGDNYNAAPLIKRDGGTYFEKYGFDFVGDSQSGNAEKDKDVDAITADMLGFIERNKDQPFFAYLAHHAPHAPMEAPRALVEKYVQRGFQRSSSPLCKTEERPTANYYAMLDHLDASVGRVVAKLDEWHLATNTVVIFYSDNGGLNRMADMTPLREAKGAPYEGGLRVPLMVRWPGRIRPGSTCEVPVHTVDLYPTFLALAGGSAPDGHHLDGLSLMPLLTGQGTFEREALFWHMPTYTPMYGRTPCAVVRQGDWKLVHYFGDFLDTTGTLPRHQELYGRLVLGGRTELYHLREDLNESHEVARANPTRVRELMARLESFWNNTGARLPKPNPAFDPADTEWWKSR